MTFDAATGPGDQAPDRRKQAEGVGARASDIRFVGLFALNTDPIIGARFPRADCRRNHRHAAGRADWWALVVHAPIID